MQKPEERQQSVETDREGRPENAPIRAGGSPKTSTRWSPPERRRTRG
jgi:hypothetical protein